MTQLGPVKVQSDVARFRPGSLLVRFRGPPDLSGHPARVAQRVRGTDFVEVTTSVPLRSLSRSLRDDPRVLDVERNHVRSAAAEPNDQLYDIKHGSARWARTVRLPEAWDEAPSASGVTIAVLDGGVDASHPDLQGRLVSGRDVVDGDAVPQDEDGHGTFVAGLAAAKSNNAIGIAGVSDAKLMPVKVLGPKGSGDDADIAAGITWATDHGADVINLSLGGPGASDVLDQAITYAVNAGAVVVAASGNFASDTPIYPAAHPDVIGVSATDWAGNFAWYSSFGSWVDVAAPGNEMISTYPDGYAQGSGTSFAAPIVSGIAAMARAEAPAATAAEISALVRSAAHDVGPPGIDRMYGRGLVDAAVSLGAMPQPATKHAVGDGHEPNDVVDRATLLPFWAVEGSSNPNPVRGTLSPEGDIDWYFTDITETRWASFGAGPDVTPFDDRATEWDAVVRVFGPDLRLLGEADHEGPRLGETVYLHVTPGRYYIQVSNTVGARSPAGYVVSSGIGARPMADTRFQPFQSYSAPDASHLAVGDVTGDGRNDVVMTTEEGNVPQDTDYSMFVYEQRDDGWLAQPLIRGLGPSPPHVAIGDMNDDGRQDVVLGGSPNSRILLQDSSGELQEAQPGPPARQMVIADMDADGRDDIATLTGSGFAVHRNTLTGFVTTNVTSPNGHAIEIEVGNVAGDSKLDVITITAWAVLPYGADVYAQTSSGSFSSPTHLSPDTSGDQDPHGLAVGDVTGDGADDIAITLGGNSGARVNVFRRSSGGFEPPAVYPVGQIPGAIEHGDVNQDGRGDVALVHDGFNEAGVLLQKNDGTLASESRYAIPYATRYALKGMALEDITSDGFPDISVADYNHGLVVLRQRTAAWPRLSPPWVRNVTPANLGQGIAPTSNVTVRFGPDTAGSSVTTETVRLLDGDGAPVAAGVSFNTATDTATIDPIGTLASGPHVVSVTGVVTTAGRTMKEVFESRFVIGAMTDTTPPDTYVFRGASGTEADGFWRFWFNATEPGTRFECRFDSGAWNTCISSDWSSLPLQDAVHTFEVRAIDGADNVDPTPASRTWTVDVDAFRPQYDCLCQAVSVSGPSGTDATRRNIEASKATNLEPAIALNEGGRDIWFRWTAPSSGTATFSTAGSDFDTLLGAFTGGNEDFGSLRDAVSIASNDDVSRNDRTSAISFPVQQGAEYQIAVDGFNDGFWVATGHVALSWQLTAGPGPSPSPSTSATASPTITPEPTPSADPSATPDPTPTVEPTPDPTPDEKPQVHSRRVSLDVRRHLIAVGRVTVADGFNRCRREVPLRIQRRRSGEWVTVARDETSDAGYFRIRLRDRRGRYRAVAPSLTRVERCGLAVSAIDVHRH